MQNLVALLVSDLDEEAATYSAITHVLVGINTAIWPSFYSCSRIDQLTRYVEFNLMAYIFDYIKLTDLVARLSRLLEMASNRDSYLIFLLSSDLESEHFGRLAA